MLILTNYNYQTASNEEQNYEKKSKLSNTEILLTKNVEVAFKSEEQTVLDLDSKQNLIERNKNWKVVGTAYNQLVFVSVRHLYITVIHV